MATPYDVIIAGLGAMGSAATFHLAQRGLHVLGLDRFAPPHDRGSSHGQTRIIREAYFEHPVYVPMVQRAYELWRELEQRSGASLLLETGGLMIGRPDSTVVRGAKLSAEQHGLRHEMLTALEVRKRFPALQPEPDMVAIWEARAGVLFPERCIDAHLQQARRHGATIQVHEPILSWKPHGTGVRVITGRGQYDAAQLVVSAGAWATSLLPDLGVPLRIERQLLLWFEPRTNRSSFDPEQCPIHLWQFDGRRFFYGFPYIGDGVKVAFHHDGATTTADTVCRETAPDEVEAMRAVLRRFLPAAEGVFRTATVCLYTNTPDEHFRIDRYPPCPQVWVVSPCSGHGFKFSAAIGEIVADLVQNRPPRVDLELFHLRQRA